MIRGTSLGRLFLVFGLVSGCSSEPVAPTSAVLDLRLTVPTDDVGAVLFTVSGGPVDSVEAAGYPLQWAQVDATTLRIIVLGDLRSGRIGRIHIADERLTSHYVAVIDQVAVRRTYAQADPLAYTLNLTP